MDQARARSSELSLIVPCGWEGPKYLRHQLLLPRVHISRALESGVELVLKPGTQIWNTGISRSAILTSVPDLTFYYILCHI